MTTPDSPKHESNRYDVLQADFALSVAMASQLPASSLIEVAFAGRSNVGKSSLMNALVQRKNLVRTSSTPGCTRAINVFQATTRSGLSAYLVDLPGYGYARRSKEERLQWGPLLEGYIAQRENLKAVVVIIDVRRGVEDDDRALIEFCEQARTAQSPLEIWVVATKVDLISKSKRKITLANIQKSISLPLAGFSTTEADFRERTREQLWRSIETLALKASP